MQITDGFVRVWRGNPHVLLLAGRVGSEGYFVLDMIEFVERHMAEFRIFSGGLVHPLNPEGHPEGGE